MITDTINKRKQSMKDTIYRDEAIKAIGADIDEIDAFDPSAGIKKACIRRAIWKVMGVPSADRPQDDDWEKYSEKLWRNAYERGKADGAMIYGNEHNCIMTIFGECSYAETGCGDCAVVEKVRKALSADRPQGEWIDAEIPLESGGSMPIQACNLCKTFYPLAYTGGGHRFCPNCGAKMKGADDED